MQSLTQLHFYLLVRTIYYLVPHWFWDPVQRKEPRKTILFSVI